MNLSQDNIVCLIEAYHLRPELWDSTRKEYSDRSKRRDAWSDIAANVNINSTVAEKKIKSLRTHFMSLHKNYVKIKNESGSGIDEVQKPKWFAYSLLEFLLKGTKMRSNGEILIGTRDEEAACDISSEDIDTKDPRSATRVENKGQQSTTNDSATLNSGGSNSKKHKCINDTHMDSAYNFKKRMSGVTFRDEFRIFGEYVAVRLRNIKDDKIRLLTQQNIMNILFEAEFTNYELGHNSSGPHTPTFPITNQYSPLHLNHSIFSSSFHASQIPPVHRQSHPSQSSSPSRHSYNSNSGSTNPSSVESNLSTPDEDMCSGSMNVVQQNLT